MKRLVFLILTLFLLSFNYGCFQKIMKISCKSRCNSFNNDPKFCKRICEKEIFEPKWKLLGFYIPGLAYFYDLVSTSDGIVKVWLKTIYSEKGKQDYIKLLAQKKINVKGYENLDYTLELYKINCSEGSFQALEFIDYASNGSIIDNFDLPEYLAKWDSIPPGTAIEMLFVEVCKPKK